MIWSRFRRPTRLERDTHGASTARMVRATRIAMTLPTLALAWRLRPSRVAPRFDRACARNGATAREARRSGERCMLLRRCRGTAVAATTDPATRARVPSAWSECPRAFVRSSSPARGVAERDLVRSLDARLVLVRSRNGLACARSALAPPAAVSWEAGRLLRSGVPSAGVYTIAAADDSGGEGELGTGEGVGSTVGGGAVSASGGGKAGADEGGAGAEGGVGAAGGAGAVRCGSRVSGST